MLRTLTLAIRSSLILMVAGSLATADLRAQHPVVTPSKDSVGVELQFELSNATSGAPRHAMLACYFNIEGDNSGISKLMKKSVGAVAPYSSTAPGAAAFTIPNADTSAANAIPSSEFSVPPAIIAHALAEVNLSHPGEYMNPFAATAITYWNATGLGGSNSANALAWPTLVGNSTAHFSSWGLATALVARQIAYLEGSSPTDDLVKTKADAIVNACWQDEQEVTFNTVLIEVLELPTASSGPIKIKLSKSKKLTMRLPGSGSGLGMQVGYHWNYVYPAYANSKLAAVLAGGPLPGVYQMFVTTSSGLVAVNAELKTIGQSFLLEAEMPANIITGPFALWNATLSEYITMKGMNGPTLSNWTYFSHYPDNYVQIPMPVYNSF